VQIALSDRLQMHEIGTYERALRAAPHCGHHPHCAVVGREQDGHGTAGRPRKCSVPHIGQTFQADDRTDSHR